MESPVDRMPPELLAADKKAEVVSYLQSQPWPGRFKLRVLKGWSLMTGASVTPRELELVEKSGP